MTDDFSKLGGLFVLIGALSSPAASQPVDNVGFVLGKVYEVDKERYRDYVESRRRLDPDFDETKAELDAQRFLESKADVTVTARQLTTNQRFSSDFTNAGGDYMIRDTPVGTFQFNLLWDGDEFAVQQRLDLNVQLSYVAELCFVIDREERVAWMVADGPRRTEDVPPWVPRTCLSTLSECLAVLVGPDGTPPDGLLLLLAGSGATAAAIGIISSDQVEASSPAGSNTAPP